MTPGRYDEDTQGEVVPARSLRAALVRLNPDQPDDAYDDAVRQLAGAYVTQSLAAINREKYELIRDGVQVTFRNDKGERERRRLRIIDFGNPDANEFLCVREL